MLNKAYKLTNLYPKELYRADLEEERSIDSSIKGFEFTNFSDEERLDEILECLNHCSWWEMMREMGFRNIFDLLDYADGEYRFY